MGVRENIGFFTQRAEEQRAPQRLPARQQPQPRQVQPRQSQPQPQPQPQGEQLTVAQLERRKFERQVEENKRENDSSMNKFFFKENEHRNAKGEPLLSRHEYKELWNKKVLEDRRKAEERKAPARVA